MRHWKRGLVWTGTLDELLSNDANELAKGLGKLTRPDLPKPKTYPYEWVIVGVDRERRVITINADPAAGARARLSAVEPGDALHGAPADSDTGKIGA